MTAVANGTCCNVRNSTQTEARSAKPQTARYVPAVDIVETDAELVITADMPGVSAEAVSVEFDRGVLTLAGRVERRPPEAGRLLTEYGVGDYHRTFEIKTP